MRLTEETFCLVRQHTLFFGINVLAAQSCCDRGGGGLRCK